MSFSGGREEVETRLGDPSLLFSCINIFSISKGWNLDLVRIIYHGKLCD